MEVTQRINCVEENTVFRFATSGGELRYHLERQLGSEDRFLIFDLINHNSFDACLELHFYSQVQRETPSFSIILAILPHLKTPVVVPLEYLNGQSMNGASRQGILCTAIDGTRLALEDISEIGIFMSPSHTEPLLSIENVRFSQTDVDISYDFDLENLVDEFGQYKGRDWPGKTKDLEELKQYLNSELEIAKSTAAVKKGFYGQGEAIYKAAGYFHLEENEDGQKILVTPDGKEFFSLGCAVVIPNITGPLGAEKDHNYLKATLERVWPSAAYENWQTLTKYRLDKWGMNTVAAWSDLNFAQKAKMPYSVFPEKSFPTSQKKIYRDFPDVFSKEYQENAKVYAESLAPYTDDPYVIGYFMTNEPNWAFVPGLNLAYECLISPNATASKVQLIDWLKNKFGTIEAVNQAFESEFESFQSLGKSSVQTLFSEKALEILDEFTEILVREFVRVPAEELRRVAPNHLNLGMRYAFISSPHLFAGSEFMDIYSMNCYNISPAENIERIYKATGLPVMIGEFHFGALDRGLPATGIQGVLTQKERGRAIHNYIESAKATGHCLGLHHFQLNDEPYLGRFDGENYNIGLIDICDREYEEVTDEFKPIQHIPPIFF